MINFDESPIENEKSFSNSFEFIIFNNKNQKSSSYYLNLICQNKFNEANSIISGFSDSNYLIKN